MNQSQVDALIEQAIQGHASTRDAMRWLVEQATNDTDTARLDWIERQSLEDFALGLVVDADHDGEYWCSPDTGGMYYGPTLRAAIDAARKGTP